MTLIDFSVRLRQAQARVAELERELRIVLQDLAIRDATVAALTERLQDAHDALRREQDAASSGALRHEQAREIARLQDTVRRLDQRLDSARREIHHWETTHGACSAGRLRFDSDAELLDYLGGDQ